MKLTINSWQYCSDKKYETRLRFKNCTHFIFFCDFINKQWSSQLYVSTTNSHHVHIVRNHENVIEIHVNAFEKKTKYYYHQHHHHYHYKFQLLLKQHIFLEITPGSAGPCICLPKNLSQFLVQDL